jgi:3-methyladenine DNA glycosylase AlkD
LTSEATERAVAFVAAHKPAAETLGITLAEHVNDPDAFVRALDSGLRSLADPEYQDGQHLVAPGLGPTYGVRFPLLAAVIRTFGQATRGDRPTPLLFLADRLFHEERLELRWFAFALLERTLAADPERSWQLMRRGAREAADWITVDDLAHPYAAGIAAEPYRWAELEQLVFSPSRWERRLVGSTIATMTHGDRRTGRGPEVVDHALPLLGQLIGDAEPEVQKALSWAYRSLARIDRARMTQALYAETDRAVATDDGHRAWVIRDSLSKLDPADAIRLRDRLGGIRRRPGGPSTSDASTLVGRFGAMPDPATHPEPPLT